MVFDIPISANLGSFMRAPLDPTTSLANLRKRALALADDLEACGEDLAAALAGHIGDMLEDPPRVLHGGEVIEFPERQIS
jgi:hypothetical protein